MSVTIETDNGLVELKGAATESTLARLVNALEKSADSKDGFNKKLKGLSDGAADYTKKNKDTIISIKTMGKGADDAADELDNAARSAGGFANRAKGMIKGLIDGAEGLVRFAGTTAGTGMNMNQLAQSAEGLAKHIPLIGGLGGAAVGAIVGHTANLIDTFEGLSSTGAMFTNNLFDLERTAANSYLSLEQMTSIVRSNSESLAVFGGNAKLGAKRFAELNQVVINTSRRDFAMLGISATDSAEMLASYTAVQARNTQFSTMGVNQQAQAGANFVKQITLLANLTGQDRKALAAKMAQEKKRADVELAMSRLAPEAAANVEAALNFTASQFGADSPMIDALRTSLLGLPAASSTAANMLLSGPLGPTLDSMGKGLMNGTTDLQSFFQNMMNQSSNFIEGTKSLEGAMQFSETVRPLVETSAGFLNMQKALLTVQKDYNGDFKAFVDGSKPNLDGTSRAVIDTKLAIEDFGKNIRLGFNTFTESSVKKMKEGVDALNTLLDKMPKSLQELMDMIGEQSGTMLTGTLFGLKETTRMLITKFKELKGALPGASKVTTGAEQGLSKVAQESAKKSTGIFSKITGFLGKIGTGLGILGAGATAVDTYKNSEMKTTTGKAIEASGSGLGTFGGSIAGAKVGLLTGAALGSIVPFVGNIVGGAIGAVLGGIGGGFLGDWAGSGVARDIGKFLGFAEGGIVTQPIMGAAIAEKPGTTEGVFPLPNDFKADDLGNLKDIQKMGKGIENLASAMAGFSNAELVEQMKLFNKNIKVVANRLT